MAEYIDRAEAMHIAFRSPFFSDSFVEEIKAIPAADVAPIRHGKRIRQDNTFTRFKCSACGDENHKGNEKYCSSCGAKMDWRTDNGNGMDQR